MTERQFATADPLQARTAVCELWTFCRKRGGSWDVGLPKPFVELVFNFGGEFDWREQRDGPTRRYGAGWLTPIQAGPREARASDGYDLVGARLFPLAAVRLFGKAALAGTPRTFSEVGQAWLAPLWHTLAGAGDDRMALLDLAIAQRWSDLPVDIVQLPSDATLSVTELADAVGMSERTLRRFTAKTLGITPKRWLRLCRFDQALRDTQRDAASLAAVAAETGYSDQAHMAREFATLAARPPTALRGNRNRAEGIPPHFVPG